MPQHLDQNIHILLPKEDLKILKRHAQQEKKSLAELIRRAIRKVYGKTEPSKRAQAFERLSQRSELVMEDWQTVKEDLLKRYD
jgi:hypothetical protein